MTLRLELCRCLLLCSGSSSQVLGLMGNLLVGVRRGALGKGGVEWGELALCAGADGKRSVESSAGMSLTDK